ncbi:gliding motility-associated C-terminal domain-containing protein [Chitinophaga sp. CF418]|uniref:T9SS type B sorting domain-containing protein n=1 Tax=Chitinophaga sp. CF418 TaxID=1855287 RepID=UPI00091729EC|nr:gliding motility-associated C-terminal domain-containing protein [Chitinophaga sp. CF418]SHN27686.1 gliding motility-associated C-terminal domain-containing protein [Chitinophaga sp. CF418]
MAQQASFTAPDTVCVSEPVNLANTSTGGSSYYWSFCAGNLFQDPEGLNLGNPSNVFSIPTFVDMVKEGNDYYVFVTNNAQSIVRMFFGNSLLNTPVVNNLGNVGGNLPPQTEGLQIIQDADGWHIIIVGGGGVTSPQIAKLDFGSSLNNTPTSTNWGNIGTLAYPVDLYMFQDAGSWHGLTINADNNTITRFDFGTSFNSPPTGTNLGNLGNLDFPTGIYTANYNGNWYVFVTNGGNNTITRLDFGNSLLNTPVATNMGNPNGLLNAPRDIYIVNDCGGVFGLVANGEGDDILKLEFGGGSITGNITATSYGNIGGLDYPHSLSTVFRVKDDLYTFVASARNSTIARLKFSSCTNSSIPSSTLVNPPSFTYNQPGTYTVNMIMDEGLPSQQTTCRNIVVVPPPVVDLGSDVTSCNGTPVLLNAGTGFSSYKWSDNSTGITLGINTSGTYSVEVTNGGSCTATDDVVVNIDPSLDATLNTTMIDCRNSTGSIVVNASGGTAPFTYTLNGVDKGSQNNFTQLAAGTYTIDIKDNLGCTISRQATIIAVPPPVVDLGSDVTTCNGTPVLLNAGNGFSSYQWSDNSTGSTLTVNTSGTYSVVVTDANGCTATDDVVVNISPTLDATLNTTMLDCRNPTGSIVVNPSGGIAPFTYTLNGTDKGSQNSFTQLTAGTYTIGIKDNLGCTITRQATIILDQTNTIDISAAGQSPSCEGVADGAITTTVISGPPPFEFAIDNQPYQTGTTFNNLAAGTYKVYGRNSYCLDSATVTLTAPTAIDLAITPVDEYCARGNGELTISVNGGAAPYKYEVNGVVASSTHLTQLSAGNYNVVVTDAKGCRASSNAEVDDIDIPAVTITNNDTTISLGDQVQLHAINAPDYSWTPVEGLNCVDCASPIAQPMQRTTYIVSTVTGLNCIKEDRVTIYVDTRRFLIVPTAFTPNKDGVNDVFRVKAGGVAVFRMSVYNRWGELVFTSSDLHKGWDGTYVKELQPNGAYVYMIEYSYYGNEGKIYGKKGTVTLIR